MEGPQDKCFEVPENSKSYKYQITNKYYGSNDLVSFRTVSRPWLDFQKKIIVLIVEVQHFLSAMTIDDDYLLIYWIEPYQNQRVE